MKSLNTDFLSVSERIDTSSSLGRAFFATCGIMAQLEREILIERVKNGLANAKAKGVRIGRVKTRPSELIRALLSKGLSQRVVAGLANTSNGSVSLEKKLMKLEKLAMEKKKLDEQNSSVLSTGDLNFDISQNPET
jgi:DNA invertase Pin-like site-specific DNA recombinase